MGVNFCRDFEAHVDRLLWGDTSGWNYSVQWNPAIADYQTRFPVHFCTCVTVNSRQFEYNRRWLNLNHFEKCSNFEQSLLKMVTRRKRWSTSPGSGWPEGRSLVVQVSGGALARTSSVNPPTKIKSNFCREIGSTHHFEQGLRPALFFGWTLPAP
jgi:hypothetical protein